jgi:hypothetical protein
MNGANQASEGDIPPAQQIDFIAQRILFRPMVIDFVTNAIERESMSSIKLNGLKVASTIGLIGGLSYALYQGALGNPSGYIIGSLGYLGGAASIYKAFQNIKDAWEIYGTAQYLAHIEVERYSEGQLQQNFELRLRSISSSLHEFTLDDN